jgi:hypothetical protein
VTKKLKSITIIVAPRMIFESTLDITLDENPPNFIITISFDT